MANQTIPNLPPALTVTGLEQLWAVQNGSDVRITLNQIATLLGFGNFQTDVMTVVGSSIVTPLTYVPNGTIIYLVVNGAQYFPNPPNVAFTYIGTAVSWISPSFSLSSTDSVIAVYTH